MDYYTFGALVNIYRSRVVYVGSTQNKLHWLLHSSVCLTDVFLIVYIIDLSGQQWRAAAHGNNLYSALQALFVTRI